MTEPSNSIVDVPSQMDDSIGGDTSEDTPMVTVSNNDEVVGSMDNLDTIALETSPTLESLDLDKISRDIDLSSLRESSIAIDENEEVKASTKIEIEDVSEKELKKTADESVTQSDDFKENVYERTGDANRDNPLIQTQDVDGKKGISSYFKDSSSNSDSTFFDNLASDDNALRKQRSHSGGSISSESSHSRTRTYSGSVQTVEATFEGENLEKVKDEDANSVRKLISDVDPVEVKDGKDFFEHFTAEVEEADEPVQNNESLSYPTSSSHEKDQFTQKPPSNINVFVLPHLSPGPSPNTSAYASPIHCITNSSNTPGHQPNLDVHLGLKSASSSFSHDGEQKDDDPFSASIALSESERRKNSWIPSDGTKQLIMSMATSAPGTFSLRSDQVTLPGLSNNDSQGDPVRDLMVKCFGELEASKRQSLGAEDVSQDEEGLRQLIRADSLRSAVDLTGRLLTNCGQGLIDRISHKPDKSTPETLQLWFTRIALLVKLKQYVHAEAETQAFGNFDRPDLYYEYYQDTYPGKKGSMVPFSFRILHAELPHFLGHSQDALDRLYYVYSIVKKVLDNLECGLAEDGSAIELSFENRKASKELWEEREIQVLYSILNILAGIKVFENAVDILETLIEKDVKNRMTLWSGIGRLYLQMGDLNNAQIYFNKVSESLVKTDQKKCQVHMNRGFMALGINEFEEAKACFKTVIEMDLSLAVAANNMAVCCLYMGKLKEALSILENLIHRNPGKYLQEGLLINLCTLYELESSHALHKKQALLELVSKHKGNGFNTHCLKMSELLTKK